MPEDQGRFGPDRRLPDRRPQGQDRGWAQQRPATPPVGTDDWWAARAAQAGGGLPPEDAGWLVEPSEGGAAAGPETAEPAAPPASGLPGPTGRQVGVVSGMAARPPLPSTRAARRRSTHTGGVSAGRAVAGAGVAVAGVALGIGALLWASDDPTSSTPTVQALISGPEAATATAPNPPAGARGTAPVAPSRPSPSPSRPARPSSPAASQGPPPTASRGPAALSLTVLNNSRFSGLARQAAGRFRAGGYPVGAVGNFTGRISATTVYYSPGSARQAAAARALARRYPGVRRVLPRFPGLPGSGLTVVVTRDFRD